MKYPLVTALLAVLFVALAAAAGSYRRAAVIGAATAGFTAVASILAMSRVAQGANPSKRVLAVFGAVFLVRLVLVAAGTVVVAQAGLNVWAFVVALFLPYFVFSAIEALFLHSLRSNRGTTA